MLSTRRGGGDVEYLRSSSSATRANASARCDLASLVTVCRPRSVARIARSISRRRGWETREEDPGWWSEETSDDGLEGGGDDDASGPYGNAGAASRARTAARAASVVGRGRPGARRARCAPRRRRCGRPRAALRLALLGDGQELARGDAAPGGGGGGRAVRAKDARSPRARRAVDVVGDGFLALAPAPLRVDARVALFVPLIVSESAPEALERRSREASMARGIRDPGVSSATRESRSTRPRAWTARVDRAKGRARSSAVERGRVGTRAAVVRGEGARVDVASPPREVRGAAVAETAPPGVTVRGIFIARTVKTARRRLFRPGEPVTEKRSARAPDWSEFG